MDLLLIIPAMFLAWYDFRIRRIIVWQLLVFCMSCIGISFYSYGITETLWHIAWNILLLTYLGAGVENMDVVKCENKFLNPYYSYILLKYK